MLNLVLALTGAVGNSAGATTMMIMTVVISVHTDGSHLVPPASSRSLPAA